MSRSRSRTAANARGGALPVVNPDPRGCGTLRPSRRGRWRALSLIVVHVLFGIHILHWVFRGRTLTPLEPSEAMETLGRGAVNAGFLFFALLILSTLVLGRFFCGWGCHIVALQDLCTWLLKRAGIRPRPFRSRLLVFVPLLAAIWMFAAPTLVRLWMGAPTPAWHNDLVSDDFWGRFPGWPVALLTFAVCGFLIVWLLGNKGFCTYGCPYGGIFGVVDRIAPGRIRVTDACEGCGHCTATCTSNVKVHEEVRLYGAVVDSGCMKCMDCVSVCPKDALYFGFGAPAVMKGAPRGTPRPRRHDYTWAEEGAMAAVFLVTLVILRALYEAVPFLLALGLAACGTWLVVTAARVIRTRGRVQFLHVALADGGRRTPAGGIFLAVAVLWGLLLVHSAAVQVLTISGTRSLNAALTLMAREGPDAPGVAPLLHAAASRLRRADALGLVTVPGVQARLGSAHSHLGDHARAEEWYRSAAEAAPSFALAQYEIARYALARQDRGKAIAALEAVIEAAPEYPGAAEGYVRLLIERGEGDRAVGMMETLARRRPHSAALTVARAIALAGAGRDDEAMDAAHRAIEEDPGRAEAWNVMAGLRLRLGDDEGALEACGRSVAIRPDAADWLLDCSRVAVKMGRWETARDHLERARVLRPFDRALLDGWSLTLLRTGGVENAIARLESEGPRREARFALVSLYRASGRFEEATAIEADLARER